jgi:hypothetical protein
MGFYLHPWTLSSDYPPLKLPLRGYALSSGLDPDVHPWTHPSDSRTHGVSCTGCSSLLLDISALSRFSVSPLACESYNWSWSTVRFDDSFNFSRSWFTVFSAYCVLNNTTRWQPLGADIAEFSTRHTVSPALHGSDPAHTSGRSPRGSVLPSNNYSYCFKLQV